MKKSSARLALWLLLGILVVLMASIPAKASYSPAALRQCIYTPPPELGLQLKPELPVQLRARDRDYILVRYRAEGTIYGYGVIEVAAKTKCWNPSAEPSFDVDAMFNRLPLPVASRFKSVLRKDKASIDKQHLESMRQGYPGVPDKTLLEWMEGDGDPRSH